MSTIHRQSRGLAIAALAGGILAIAAPDGASAYTDVTMHRFCSKSGCTDGANPYGGLIEDQSGNLYGTTQSGGKYDHGIVFKLVPTTGRYREYILHNFSNGNDGANPDGDLIIDKDGNLYGTASVGGRFGRGTVFKLARSNNGWAFRVLHSFCNNCGDGDTPVAGLTYAGQADGKPWDESSTLYGTTEFGGEYDNGAVYELTYFDSNWLESVVHNFKDSNTPNALIEDSAGNLYGTTFTGGKYGCGLIFKLASGTWSPTVLHNFCSSAGDGANPLGRLLVDASGNLLGTTFGGGANPCGLSGCGTIFILPTGGSYGVIYNFCSSYNCPDGANPYAGLITDGSGSGNVFGTTFAGGKYGYGVVFKFNYANSSQTQLHSFCARSGCPDGASPLSALIRDGSGNLFGTTYENDGTGNYQGTAFKLTP